jgi:hypothetical protein
MQHLPEPVVKEERMTKVSDYDPKIIADAYERFLNGDSLDTIVIEMEIPKRVIGYHARRDGWIKRKAELTDSFRLEADQRYLENLAKVRLPTAQRQLRMSQLVDDGLIKLLEDLEHGEIPDEKTIIALRRISETMAQSATVSSRAAGITDRPAAVGGQEQQQTAGRQPLIMIGIQPTVDNGGPVIDIKDYTEIKKDQ